MFFILSKLLLIFILPLSWITAFLIAALAVKKQVLKRRFLITAISLLFIFSSSFFLNLFAKYWDIKPVPLKQNGSYSCVIVLGGFSSEGADGKGFFNGACDRFLEGLKLIATKKATHILITGGNGAIIPDGFAESDWVKTQLKEFNVPDSCILIENKSRNTIENAAFSKIILNKSKLKGPYILVTSAFHMRRSLGIFKNAGINVIPYPSNYLAGSVSYSPDQFIPDAYPLGIWNIYTKEVVGTLVNHITGK